MTSSSQKWIPNDDIWKEAMRTSCPKSEQKINWILLVAVLILSTGLTGFTVQKIKAENKAAEAARATEIRSR